MTPHGRAWVRKAEEDRRTILAVREVRPAVHGTICFHCQQMAEKYLKTLVHERGFTVPRIHDCEALVRMLLPTDPDLKRFLRTAAGLTQYAVNARYPMPGGEPNASRARSSWNNAERIRTEVRRILGMRPRP